MEDTQTTPTVHAYAEPVYLEGGEHAVLLCHGFTGSPQSLRDWAHDLHAAGYTVSLPLLPGHGTNPDDLRTRTAEEWVAAEEEALAALVAAGKQVSVAGLSMGGALALRLAETHPKIRSVVLVNPAVGSRNVAMRLAGVIRRVVRDVRPIASDIARADGVTETSYDRTPVAAVEQLVRLFSLTRKDLSRITQPVLYFRSRVDHVVDNLSETAILHGVTSDDVTLRILPRSYHVATMDHDQQMIFDETRAWLETRR